MNSAENALEQLLKVAVHEPGHRPEFYRALLDADIWILIEAGAARGRTTLPAGSMLGIVNWQREDGAYVIPFFSSVERVREAAPNWGDCALMTGRELFIATRGQLLHLNPMCEYGREFLPYEVEALLDHGVLATGSLEVLKQARHLSIEPVAAPPVPTIDALKVLYRRWPAVRMVYLVRTRDPHASATSALRIAIEADQEDDAIVHDTTTVLRDTFHEAEPIDLLFISPTDGGLGQHIARDMVPFYQRADAWH